jgi:uncharacterized protein (DUF362 family)
MNVPVAIVAAMRGEVMRASVVAALHDVVAVESMVMAILAWRRRVVAIVGSTAGRKASQHESHTNNDDHDDLLDGGLSLVKQDACRDVAVRRSGCCPPR